MNVVGGYECITILIALVATVCQGHHSNIQEYNAILLSGSLFTDEFTGGRIMATTVLKWCQGEMMALVYPPSKTKNYCTGMLTIQGWSYGLIVDLERVLRLCFNKMGAGIKYVQFHLSILPCLQIP